MKRRIFSKFKKYVREMNKSVFSYKLPALKVQNELGEHFYFIKWVLKRIFLPVAIFYLFSGFVLGVWVIDSLFLGLIIFLYSNFLPDADSIFKVTNVKSDIKEKHLVLFFAPVYALYLLSENSSRPKSKTAKPFHNLKSMVAYGIFLFAVGFILYRNWLEIASLPMFGVMGYFTHISVDKSVNIKIRKPF